MTTILGVPSHILLVQLLLGLINGAFYAILSLGLAIIFGLLRVINFAHGAQYMMGAFIAWMLLNGAGIGFWWALVIAPLVVGLVGVLIERNFIGQLGAKSRARSLVLIAVTALSFAALQGTGGAALLAGTPGLGAVVEAGGATGRFVVAILLGIAASELYGRLRPTEMAAEPLDPLYGLLLTFGLALIIEGCFRNVFGASGKPYAIPAELVGAQRLPFMVLPNYRTFVLVAALVICLGAWAAIERTRLGATLRAATENPILVQAFGIDVPRLLTLTYGLGAGLAGLAGVLAAPIYAVSPNMGADLIIVVFAVVVIGGMGSILGAVAAGFGLGLVEGLTRVFYPQATATAVFAVMVLVLIARPAGLFGRQA